MIAKHWKRRYTSIRIRVGQTLHFGAVFCHEGLLPADLQAICSYLSVFDLAVIFCGLAGCLSNAA